MNESSTVDGLTLTMWAREHLDPVFKAAGARKKGRRYEFSNDLGDVTLFDLYSRGYRSGEVGFDPGCQISPRSNFLFTAWKRHDDGFSGPLRSHLDAWLWSAGVTAPDEAQVRGHWGFWDADSAQRCAELLTAAVRDTVIPLLLNSLDRSWLLDAFVNRTIFSPHRMIGTPERTRVLLLIDDGPSTILDDALEELATSTDPRTREGDLQLLRWARLHLGGTSTLVNRARPQ